MNNEPPLQKNYIIAMTLVMLILIGYPFLLEKMGYAPAPQKPAATHEISPRSFAPSLDSVSPAASSAPSFIGNPEPPTAEYFENRFYKVQFSTLGAAITQLAFKGEEEKPQATRTVFYEAEPSADGLFGVRILNDGTDLAKAPFKLQNKDPQGAQFIYEKAGEYRVTKKFVFSAVQPLIVLQLTLENLSTQERAFPLEILWAMNYAGTIKEEEHQLEAVAASDKIHSADLGKIAKKGFFAAGDIRWAGVLKKYFGILVKPDWRMISAETKASGNILWAAARMEPFTIAANAQAVHEVLIYAGPQHYETLKDLNLGFEEILSRGFFGMFKIWLLIALKFLYRFAHNYGWAIILLTILLKGAFTPLTHMSYESMKKMQAIQPKLKSLQERYKSDPTKLNREMMELYKRNKVNPMAGCLPMLAQIPVFIAFYQVLNETIELKGAPFIYWVKDLSQPDILFTLPFSIPFLGEHFHFLPILMILSMWGQQKVMPAAAMSPEQAKMMEFMPFIFGVLFYKMPSGLVLYWFVNNMLTILHQVFIKRMVVVLHHEDRD